MKTTLYGNITKPVLAVVGSWDPLLPQHEELFRRLCQEAKKRSLCSLAVLLDPAPASYLPTPWVGWPIYEETDTRIGIIRNYGLDGVLLLHFTKDDLGSSAADLFNVILPEVTIAELWIGAQQSFGRGEGGSQKAILQIAKKEGIRLIRLADKGGIKIADEGYKARSLLASGHVTAAIEVVGRPPIRSRSKSGVWKLPWRSGRYRVVPLDNPLQPLQKTYVDIELVPNDDGFSIFQWPSSQIQYLAFVAGPAD